MPDLPSRKRTTWLLRSRILLARLSMISWCTTCRPRRSARPAATSLPSEPISRVIATNGMRLSPLCLRFENSTTAPPKRKNVHWRAPKLQWNVESVTIGQASDSSRMLRLGGGGRLRTHHGKVAHHHRRHPGSTGRAVAHARQARARQSARRYPNRKKGPGFLLPLDHLHRRVARDQPHPVDLQALTRPTYRSSLSATCASLRPSAMHSLRSSSLTGCSFATPAWWLAP